MMTKIAVALAAALAVGTVQAAESIKPLRGETAVSFQCRQAHIPEVRQCTALCDASDADARFECVHACTVRGLWSMAQCRDAGGAATSAVAAR